MKMPKPLEQGVLSL